MTYFRYGAPEDYERQEDSLSEQYLASLGIIGVADVPAELMQEARADAWAQLGPPPSDEP